MLAQDGFIAPNMSGEVQRSSWKVEAIRRGDLKISGPIPITEEVPLNDDEEREYAQKQSTDLPLPSQDAPEQLAQDHLPQFQEQPSQREDGSQPQSPNEVVDAQPPPREEQSSLCHKSFSTGAQQSNGMHKRTSTEPAPYSTPSPFPSIPESTTRGSPRKKRKSGLRNVFRKMFGRRSREGHEDNHEEPAHRGHGYHVSEPGMMTQSPERQKGTASGQRISDLPVRELEPIKPLGQHLPFPMNVNAPQEASPHEYLTFHPATPEAGRRRATLPTVLANLETRSWHGSKERLGTWDEQHEGETSPQIGVALSSPPRIINAQSIQSKRRSRSAGALRDLAKARPSTERRRSAEIRYWRNSFASASIYSTNTRPQTARTVDTVRTHDTRETRETTAHAAESISEMSPVHADVPPIPQHDQDISEIPISVEAFNFGNLKSDFAEDGGQEQADEAPAPSERRLSIEERVKYLEENMRTLESAVRRISGQRNRQTIILENAPKGRRSRNRSSSATSERNGSQRSSRSSSHTLHGRQESDNPDCSPTIAPPLSAVSEFPSSKDQHRQTIIAATDQRPSTAQRSDLAAQLATIRDALNHERGARKQLEKQVSALQKELYDLHAVVQKLLLTNASTTSPSYPTPSPDAIPPSTRGREERLSTPRASKGQYPPASGSCVTTTRAGAVRASTELEGFGMHNTIITGKFSRSQSSSESLGDDGITSPEDEVWATPKETAGGFGGSGFFRSESRGWESGGEEDDDEMF